MTLHSGTRYAALVLIVTALSGCEGDRGGSWSDGPIPAPTPAPTPAPNRAPIADAGPDREVLAALTVSLDGSGSSDVDGDPLTYSWVQTAGPTVT